MKINDKSEINTPFVAEVIKVVEKYVSQGCNTDVLYDSIFFILKSSAIGHTKNEYEALGYLTSKVFADFDDIWEIIKRKLSEIEDDKKNEQ